MRETVQQIIYDEVITAVLKIISRLNLSSKSPFTENEVEYVLTCLMCVCVSLCMCIYTGVCRFGNSFLVYSVCT